MNRTILFKAQVCGSKEWVTGDLVHGNDHVFIGYNAVIPDTVSQFTGLKDKNGVKIFEGDIVSIYNKYFGIRNYLVIWDETTLSFALTELFGESITIISIYSLLTNSNIIGNRWDNSELLEVKP